MVLSTCRCRGFIDRWAGLQEGASGHSVAARRRDLDRLTAARQTWWPQLGAASIDHTDAHHREAEMTDAPRATLAKEFRNVLDAFRDVCDDDAWRSIRQRRPAACMAGRVQP
jgi:hypothetical protein